MQDLTTIAERGGSMHPAPLAAAGRDQAGKLAEAVLTSPRAQSPLYAHAPSPSATHIRPHLLQRRLAHSATVWTYHPRLGFSVASSGLLRRATRAQTASHTCDPGAAFAYTPKLSQRKSRTLAGRPTLLTKPRGIEGETATEKNTASLDKSPNRAMGKYKVVA